MAKFDKSAEMGKLIFYNFVNARRKELGISQLELAEMIGVSEKTLIRNLKGENEMTFLTSLKICGALKLRPFWIPEELDKTEMQRMFFS